jgi:hypothetical protein
MPGLVPGIHVLGCVEEDVDGRDKPGHDDGTRHYWAHFNWPMEPAIARVNKSGRLGKFLHHFR